MKFMLIQPVTRYLLPAILLCFFSLRLSAQQFSCDTPGDEGGNKGLSAGCPEADFTPDEIAALPHVTVKVNIHFVGSNYGNFYPGGPNDWSATNGDKYAELMLINANQRMADLLPSPTSLADFLGDSKVRYELYTDPNNPNDLHGGVWYWDNYSQLQFPYGDNVLNIVFVSTGSGVGGSACGLNLCNSLNLIDAYQDASGSNTWGWWSYAHILNHEFGHITGLCHAFYCNNACSGIDLDPVVECNKNGHCYNSCGATPGAYCDPWNSGSLNMMGYNGANQALTPCQWQIMMKNLVYHTPKWACFCDTPADPLVIASGDNIIWDKLKIMNRDVIIEPLASLTINCEVRMGEGRSIFVNRGSRLKVDGGKITNLCKGTKWASIRVYGNNDISHAGVSATGALVANNPGIVLLDNATIEYGLDAISCNPPVSWPELVKNWNGLIIANNTTFRNNRRSVEFMLDDKTDYDASGNFSVIGNNINRSAFVNCDFLNEDGTARRGVTDWAAGTITFTGCKFEGFPELGLGVADAAVVVRQSQFNNNYWGIHASATSDLAGTMVIGGSNAADGNTFNNNYNGIYCSVVQDLLVANNQFINNHVNFHAYGSAEYQLHHNLFSGGIYGVNNVQTGPAFKQVYCNDYAGLGYGVSNMGNNIGLQIAHEDFNTATDLYLSEFSKPSPPEQGRLPDQGNFSAARWNYFTNNNSFFRVVTEGDTKEFNYFYPTQNSTVSSRTDPGCSINNGTSCPAAFNFYSYQTAGGSAACLDIFEGNPPTVSTTSLNDVRAQIDIVKAQIASGKGNKTQLEGQLSYLEAEKGYIIENLVSTYLSGRDFASAETLFQEENDYRKLVGVKILEGNWALAQQAVDAMPANSVGDQYFKQTQTINLKRLEAPSGYNFDPADEATLNAISASNTDAAPYARGLLTLVKETYFDPELPAQVGPRFAGANPTATLEKESHLIVAPNPTTGTATLTIPAKWVGQATQVDLVNLTGQRIKSVQLAEQTQVTLTLDGLPKGIYLIALRDKDRVIDQAKLILQY